jgi:FkbM family methyltransferase
VKQRGDFDTLRQYLRGERISVVDVGARQGLAPRWRRYESLIEVIGFEPDAEECERLISRVFDLPYVAHFFPVGLGSADGAKAWLHICKQPGCSSLFVPNESLVRQFAGWQDMQVVNQIEVPLSRLDTVLAQGDLCVEAIKIDAQGAELDVLKGMGVLLPSTLVVELEVEFVEQYVGQPVFREIDAFMHDAGFVLRGLRRTFWRHGIERSWRRSYRGGQIIHGDALYVNRALGPLVPVDPNLPLVKLLKGLVVLSAYGQDDLVMRILSKGEAAAASIPESDRRRIGAELIEKRHNPLGKILDRFMRTESNRTLRRLVDRIRDADAPDWHDPQLY